MLSQDHVKPQSCTLCRWQQWHPFVTQDGLQQVTARGPATLDLGPSKLKLLLGCVRWFSSTLCGPYDVDS